MKPTSLFVLTLGLLALLGGGNAQAQFFHDPVLQALMAAEKMAELDKLAKQRTAARADDAQAVLGLALAAMSDLGGPARREAAIRQAEGCVKQAPQAAECHYALGVVLGMHAMSQGMVKIAASIGTVKTALLESMTLAPQWYPARSAVVEFYDETLADDVQQWLAAAGFGLLGKGQAVQARPVFERLLREHPAQAMGAYRLGIALQAQGQAEPAKAALARFVAAGKGDGKALDDAKKRLVQLGQPAG